MKKISNEVGENKISINDENVKNKMKEYNKNIEDFQKIKEPTAEETNNAAKKSMKLGYEVINLYMEAIEKKYTIEYK